MAMLAGPRRKQKVINLRAKNNAWSNDSTKFGQRMLEKMGWSEGKGLGVNENGIVEHVVARFKNDDRGLGYEDKNDQWTKHEDDFNSLLANLSNGDNNDEKLHSGVSLEVKSKKSKARVHYHKFTRGKDLTRYSEKDLANIFGKKSLKSENEKIVDEIKEDNDIKPIEQTEIFFTEKGSMEDYFKSKLAALRSKSTINIPKYSENDDHNADYAFKGFSGTANGEEQGLTHQGFGFQSSFNSMDVDIEKENNITDCLDENVEHKKKNKKKKKHKCQDDDSIFENTAGDNSIDNENNSNDIVEFPCNNTGIEISDSQNESVEHKKKNKKKKKHKCENDEPIIDNITECETIIDEKIDKKKRKKKQKQDFEEIAAEPVDIKKSKKKNVKEDIAEVSKNSLDCKKSNKQKQSCIDSSILLLKADKEIIDRKESKKTKEELQVVEEHDTEEYIPKKKKKRKNRDSDK